MPPLQATPYSFSFTAGGLGVEHCQTLARIYAEEGDWKAAREKALAINAFGQGRQTSLSRVELEFRRRLQNLTTAEIELLAESDTSVARPLAFLAAVKCYALIFDFCVHTLRPKAQIYDTELRPSDLENFFEDRELEHPELAKLADTTRVKIRQNLVRILAEAGLLSGSKNPHLVPVPIIPHVAELIATDSPHWLRAFLLDDSQIASYCPA